MADATPQTTGRLTRRSARLLSKTPQVQCVGTGNPVAKTKAGATPNPTPRAALFDISNDVSNSEATSFSTPEPLKQSKAPKEEEAQPLSLQSAMHDAAAEEAVEHIDNETPQDDTSAELKEAVPEVEVHEEVVEAPAAEEVEEAPAAEEVTEAQEAAPEAMEAEDAPAASVLSGDAQARHLLGEVMAKIMSLDTRTEGLEDLYRFTKGYPDYDINKYMAKTKESFRQFLKTSIEEIAVREEEKEQLLVAAEVEEAAEEAEEMVDEPMETAEEEVELNEEVEQIEEEELNEEIEEEELNEEVEQIEAEELNEEVEQIEAEELNEEVEKIEDEELGLMEVAPEEEEITFTVAVHGAQDEEATAEEAQLSSPDMPRAPPTTPNPFYEAEDEEILVDFAPTPLASLSKRPTEAPEPVMDCGAEAEATPVPAKAALVAPQSEAGSDGGFRWLMMSPNGGTTPSQWASNIPIELQEGSLSPGEELMVDLQLPGEEEALPHQTLKSTVVVPDDFDPRSLRELRKEIAVRSKKDENQEVAVEQPKAVKKQQKEKKPKAVKQVEVVVKELEEEKEDDMVTNMSTDLLANRIRSEHPRHWRFGGSDDGAVEEVEWEDEFEYEGEEGDECQEADGLAEMLGGISLEHEGAMRGLPAAQGKHIRFDDDGSVDVSPSSHRVPLKGLPQATGKHVFFD